MSAFDVAGACLWTPLALLFWVGALTPSKPPHPPVGAREHGCFFVAVILSGPALFCIARLSGATL